jgi:YD repeat-containing protein
MPIAYNRGNKWLIERDIADGMGGLGFVRTYNSNAGTVSSFLGARWRSGFGQKLGFDGSGGNGTIWSYRPDGKSLKHVLTAGVYQPAADVTDRLYTDTSNGGAYRLHVSDGSVERYNATGQLLSITSAQGRIHTLTYSDGSTGPNGGYILNADGTATTTALPAGRLLRVSDVAGRSLQFGTDAAGRVVKLTMPEGQAILYTYDANNNLSKVTYPDGKAKSYLYGESAYTSGASLPNALTGITDEHGVRYVTYTYDAQGRAIDEVFPAVGTHTNRHQLAFGSNQTTVTDPLGTARTYTFQTILDVARSTGVSQPGGSGCGPASSSLTYDANGNVATRTDFNGSQTKYSYDLTRNLETQRQEGLKSDGTTRSETRTTNTAWHGYWRLPTKVAAPKKLTTYVYNGDTDPATGSVLTCAPAGATVPNLSGGTQPIGVLCKKTEQATTDATGSAGLNPTVSGTPSVWAWTYNAYGQVLTADGPRTDVSDVTTYTYYAADDADPGKRGNLATVTNAAGHLTQITAYDGNGNPLTLIDPNGISTTLTYDLRQRLTGRTVGSESTTYTYDAAGQLTQITRADGQSLSYTWDAAHRLTDVSDSLGNTVHYTLDAAGNRTQEDVKDPQGTLARTRKHEYDALGRLAKDIGAQNQSTLYEYDANGNRTKVTDPLNHSTLSAYDGLNRLIRLTDPGSGVTQYSYDGQDHLTQVTDPRTRVTTYTVDGLGNRSQQQSPDTGSTTRTFDAAGNELTRTDAKGQLTRTSYDALNRLTQVTYHDGSQVQYTWDSGTNGKGRLTKIEELTGSTVTGSLQYTYDAQGRIASETRSLGSLTHSTGYSYSNGQLTGQTLPSGRTLTYTRNAAGQVTQISLTDIAPNAGQTTVIASAIAYHPFGGVKNWTDGAGQVHTRTQDTDGRPSGFSLGTTPWLLNYDLAGRIQNQIDSGNATHSGTYGYDADDRLTSAVLPNTSYGYGYDATGNRVSQSVGANTRTYTIDAASNRLTNLTNPAVTNAYDANGSLTGDGTATYGYDVRGRLVSATTAAGTTSYRINALGQRVRKTTIGATPGDTAYHYDLAGHLIAESDATGKVTREYFWLDDTPLAVMQ